MDRKQETYHVLGRKLEQLLRLRSAVVAVKMIEKEAEIPANAIRPNKDRNCHLAQCQAFAMARRQNETVAMLKEDHWCFAPLIGYGLVENPDDDFVNATTDFPCFPQNRYIGMLSAPLAATSFEPDMAMVYADPGQVRRLLMAVKHSEKILVESVFDPIDSCIWSVVPVIEKGEYRITIPDPGEAYRAAVREDKLIFSIPAAKLPTLVAQLEKIVESKEMQAFEHIIMRPDFPRPPFYERLFEKWGLDVSPANGSQSAKEDGTC